MNQSFERSERQITLLMLAAAVLWLLAVPAVAGEYAALTGVKGLDTVYDVSQGSPKMANVIFWAVRDAYQNESVRALPDPASTVVVFHGPAVKLISTDRKGWKPEEVAEVDRFADTIRQMKKDGVTFEVCLYAAKVMGVDAATILPEVDRVGNGFISVAGYQAQGYSLVRIP